MEAEYQAASLYRSCQQLAPIDPNYANLPIEEGFDWYSRLSNVPFSRLYLVVFRSVRRVEADQDLLKEYDDRAYEEARQSGGLLRYFKGHVNERRECLSFCLWERQEQAQAAAGGPSHRVAARIWFDMYETYDLERYYILRGDGGDLTFSPLAVDHVVGGSGVHN